MSWSKTFAVHGHKYLIESVLMTIFMVTLAVAGTVIEHPDFPVRGFINVPWVRRGIMGACAGASLVGLIYSPWGQESGAHLNPAVTLAYWQIGKIGYRSAISYVVAQFLGALAGMALGGLLMGASLSHPDVGALATVPGKSWGPMAAFVAEWTLSFLLMVIVRLTTLNENWAKRTGLCVGIFVFLFVCIESPISGMSLNPARTLGANLLAHQARGLWIYLVAPPLGMLCAAELLRCLMKALGRPTRWVVNREKPEKLILLNPPPPQQR